MKFVSGWGLNFYLYSILLFLLLCVNGVDANRDQDCIKYIEVFNYFYDRVVYSPII